jgi:hypothetical protein
MPWDGQGNTGTIWIDDISLRETGLVNLIRRDDAPLMARRVGQGVLVEGMDFDRVVDPLMGVAAGYPGTYDYGHAAPVVTLPAGSRLAAGDQLTLDYAVAVLSVGSSMSVSMCSDDVFAAQGARFDRIRAYYPMTTRYFLEYDEIRQGNWGPDCEALGLDAGPLLARHVANTAAQLQSRVPGARTYTWNDMFDPHHNARADYYMVRGDLAGSWEGLPDDTVIVNWHQTEESLRFFAERGRSQLLGNITGANAQAMVDHAADIPGVMGLFFINWNRDAAEWDIETAAQVFHQRFGR